MIANPLTGLVFVLLFWCVDVTIIAYAEFSAKNELKAEAIKRGYAELVVDEDNTKFTKFLWKEKKMNCGCGNNIPQERCDLGFKICTSCAERSYVKPRGVMHFDHKTGGQIQILTPDQFVNHRKYNPYGRNTGRGSGLHRITRSTSSI